LKTKFLKTALIYFSYFSENYQQFSRQKQLFFLAMSWQRCLRERATLRCQKGGCVFVWKQKDKTRKLLENAAFGPQNRHLLIKSAAK